MGVWREVIAGWNAQTGQFSPGFPAIDNDLSFITGETIAAMAHGEPDSHYELSRVTTRATRAVDGWVLNGVKALVPHGEQAGFFVVSARTAHADDDALASREGFSAPDATAGCVTPVASQSRQTA